MHLLVVVNERGRSWAGYSLENPGKDRQRFVDAIV